MQDKNEFDNYSSIDMKSGPSKDLGKDLRRIAGVVANIPDVKPPDKLIESIMARIEPKKIVWWRRILRQLQIPFYITPFKVLPFGASAVACIIVALLFFEGFILFYSSEKVINYYFKLLL